MTTRDSFGNPVGDAVPYARGSILATVRDDYRELQIARAHLRHRMERSGPVAVFNFTGLERGFPIGDIPVADLDDESAPARYEPDLVRLALDHLGGDSSRHDVFLANRTTAATVATFLTLVESGTTVVGFAPDRSHVSVRRAAEVAGARFIDTIEVDDFETEVASAPSVDLVVLSRMDTSYQHHTLEAIERVIEVAHQADIPVYMDDAGGARVAPVILDQPRSLETGVDLVATGLDKYGVLGPRFGLLAGSAALVERIRTTAWSYGLEARPVAVPAAVTSLEHFDGEQVVTAVETTKALAATIADRDIVPVDETAVIASISGDAILQCGLDRAGLEEPPIVPFEATAAVSMLLLRDYGIVTVHFAGIPSGTGDFLIKFVPPETLDQFGGADRFADAIEQALEAFGDLLTETGAIEELLLGMS